MEILNKPISDFSFKDIVAFCKEGYVEGIQLDYKRELSKKGLSKHFAAFSNTRGGVIIVGVEEDKKTSKPKKWEGIKNDGKLEDRVHQYATGVEPIPSYEVHVTNEVNEKVFLLIRIFEGDRTPYYVQNNSNLWVRTGNISNPIGLASPEVAELLYRKKEKAELARDIYIKRALNVQKYAIKQAEGERLRLVAEEKAQFQREEEKQIQEIGASDLEYKSRFYSEELGSVASMCTVLLQPFYPSKALITPQAIKSSLEKIRVIDRYGEEFPSLNVKAIPEGILNFFWGEVDGFIECEQIYTNGMIYLSVDVLRVDRKDSIKKMWLGTIASKLFMTLQVACNYYQLIGYQGGLVGYLNLEGVAGVRVYRIVPEGWTRHPFFEENTERCLLDKYKWGLELDTSLLNNNKELQSFYIKKIKEIYWGLGYEDVKDDLIRAFLKQSGWLIE